MDSEPTDADGLTRPAVAPISTPKIWFGILGPLEATVNGTPIRLGGPRQRTILATLLLAPHRVVPFDRLIDTVWGEKPPSTARTQVHIAVSALRQLFEERGAPNVIVTRPPGYLIDLPPDCIDVEVFDRLVEQAAEAEQQGRIEDAAACYRQALALWRGQPLAGMSVVQSFVIRLTEKRLTVWENCLDHELALGRHNEVTAEIGQLVSQYPLRERLRAQQMLALSRSGRKGEALEAFRDARQTSINELGIDPSDELKQIEHAILVGDESTHAPLSGGGQPAAAAKRAPVLTGMLPATVAHFAGREAEIAGLLDFLSEAAADGDAFSVPLAAISGAGGVGKTTLAVHVARLAGADFPDGHMYARLQSTDGEVPPGRILDRFLRALGTPSREIPESLDERAALYRSLLGRRRILFVLDDAVNESQILPLLPGSATCAIIITSRGRLTALPEAHHVQIDLMGREAAFELLRSVIGESRVAEEPEAAEDIVGRCGGLPLALRIAAAKLAARPHMRLRRLADLLADDARRLDVLTHGGIAVRSSLWMAYDSLTPESRRLFRLLAALQFAEFPAWTAAALLRVDLDSGENALDELIEAYLVEVDLDEGGAPPRFRLHDLVMLFGRERLAAEEAESEVRPAVENFLTYWLTLAEAAHSAVYGGNFTVLHGSTRRSAEAAEAAVRLVDDPHRWLAQEHTALANAVRLAATHAFDELCWDLAVTSVTAFEAGSHLHDWRESHEAAVAAVRRAGNRRGEGALLGSLGSLALMLGQPEVAAGRFEQALAIFRDVEDQHGSALALRGLAHVDRMHGRPADAVERYEQSLAAFRTVGDRIGEAHVLTGMGKVALDAELWESAAYRLREAAEIARTYGNQRVAAQAQLRLAEMYMDRGEFTDADRGLREVLTLVREVDDAVGIAFALETLGRLRVRQGHLAEAVELFTQVLEIAREHDSRDLVGRALFRLGDLYGRLGDRSRSASHVIEAVAVFDRIGAPVWQARAREALGRLHAAAGDAVAAAEVRQAALRLLATAEPGIDAELSKRIDAQLRNAGIDADQPQGVSPPV